MNNIAQKTTNVQMTGTISCFMKRYRIGGLLKACNAYKEKGISAVRLFIYMLQMVFMDRSMYMQMKTGRWTEDFRKNTYYRFLNSVKVNWEKFCLLLSETIIRESIELLTGEDHTRVFIADDSLYGRRGYKKTELSAAVFDHVDMKTRRGFRMLTLGWSEGNTFIPVAHRLLSSPNDDKVLGPRKEVDGRTLAGRRRRQARRKATTVLVELLRDALKAGIKASYVLFDSWFAQPSMILQIKDMGLDTIAMVKKSGKTCYQWQGERLSIKEIFSRNRKRPGKARYLLSVEVTILSRDKDAADIPARIVYVRNRARKKEWLAIICTDMSLPETEIIRIYGKRWDIEVFFKSCKSCLKLTTECHSLSYDALTAHTIIVFVRYMLLALEQRNATDQRTMGELFLLMVDELEDISFSQAILRIITVLIECVHKVCHPTEEQVNLLMENFVSCLPERYQILLKAD
ncbi:MAG: transposase [Firmicutes bacterium]|nr:transposase [Bacillota bacterium]